MINPVNHACFSNIKTIAFTQNKIKNNTDIFYADNFSHSNDNIEKILEDENGHLQSLKFKRPLTVKETLYRLSQTKNEFIEYELLRKMHTLDKIEQMSREIENCIELRDIKIKSLLGVGAFAFAFETEDGKVLKLTDAPHFPEGRELADFDVPVYKSGKINKSEPFCYYLEEKLSQDNISQQELEQFTEYIKGKGYLLKDYLDGFAFDENDNPAVKIKVEQFGKSVDGKIYLLDPGCVIDPNLDKPKPSKIFKKMKKLFKF